jgi:D-alanyl-D-alanine dipeptidase
VIEPAVPRVNAVSCEDIAGHDDFRRLAAIAGIAVDLRYASERNFVGRDLYGTLDCAWLHRDTAAALARAVARLAEQAPALRLLVLDALRPHRVQIQLWDHLDGTGLRQYVADPALGSIHSFGMALDATLVDAQGRELDMGSGFDEMTELSHPQHEARHLASGALSAAALANRERLREALAAGGFHGIANEWWHFELLDRRRVREGFTRVD